MAAPIVVRGLSCVRGFLSAVGTVEQPRTDDMAKIKRSNKALSGEAAPTPASPDVAPPMPDLPPNSTFFYRHHPKRWGVMCGDLVPLLDEWRVEPGLGGTDSTGAWQRAVADMTAKGWRLIPVDVDGPGTTYVKRYQVRGGFLHLAKWAKVYAGSDNMGTDAEGYTAWLRTLVDRGLVEAPASHVLEALSERLESRRDEMIDKLHGNPSLRPEIDHMTGIIETLHAASAAQEEDEEPEPAAPMIELSAPLPAPKRRSRAKTPKVVPNAEV